MLVEKSEYRVSKNKYRAAKNINNRDKEALNKRDEGIELFDKIAMNFLKAGIVSFGAGTFFGSTLICGISTILTLNGLGAYVGKLVSENGRPTLRTKAEESGEMLKNFEADYIKASIEKEEELPTGPATLYDFLKFEELGSIYYVENDEEGKAAYMKGITDSGIAFKYEENDFTFEEELP
ncbi:MAG: hypothetical protein N4A47_01605 [Clostridia bacterium]|jgi:hypothetical protein|nr:hypothetical protein [Clostridia bacterium]